MKRFILVSVLAVAGYGIADAQRFTDNLDRGLVAVPTGSTSGSTTNVITWRRLASEYYDVTYNLYKDETKVASNLTTTCYADNSKAYPTTKYRVAAVVNGVEQAKSDAIAPWTQYVYKLGDTRCATGYLDIDLAAVYDRNGTDVTANYEPNDAEMADLDGDGELEIIIKRLNIVDASAATGRLYPQSSTQFAVIDAYNVNWQTGTATLMWRIDCGPNMVSLNATELNIIAYDWDEDGKAEVVLRGADNMIVYGSDGKTQLYTIGNMSVNTRNTFNTDDPQYAWTHTGAEYLIYMNGETGALYQKTDFPLKRLESNESSLNSAWGDDYGHRSTKFFFGAPVLDGRKASLFMARGIYTRHKMIAMDLNRGSHTWSTRWTWNNNSSGSAWYGNGYHNFTIADVDEDGRDEIVYGSMVIDDNGKGLSTTAYGHGDAMHVSDFDPYRKGLEFFGCLEESRGKYGCNYRNATTSEVYYKHDGSKDDGRALMGNFSNNYPGCQGRSVQSGMIASLCSNTTIDALGGDSFIEWGDLNFRIYWDGDLCSEILNSPGTAREAKIEKPGYGRLFTSSGSFMNNDSKNNPCFQGDIIGDWREEIVLRRGTGLRVYTTGYYTSFSLPCLWYDHQYRQAMVWQMMAYNQPPHLSYFLGEMEGLTMAPPPLTLEGRVEVANGSTIATTNNHLLMSDAANMTVNVADGAAPYILTVNTPSWVQGNNDNSRITTTSFTHTLTGGAFSGKMRLVKQGDGTLVLPKVTETYNGETSIWGGTLQFDGTLKSSPLWLNRFTTLVSDGGSFNGGITMEYAARILPGGESHKGHISTSSLTMNMGSRLVIDLYATGECDQVNATALTINTKNWEYGPKYLKPVIQFVPQSALPGYTYLIGNITTVSGSIDNLIVEGLDDYKYELKQENGQLLLVINGGSATECAKADISETTLASSPEGILLPQVKATAQQFTMDNGSLVTPTLTATFTDLNGNVSNVETVNTLFHEDFEGSTTPSDYWVRNNSAFIYSPTFPESTGQCIAITSSADRGDYTAVNADYTGLTTYKMEFDAYFNNASKTTDFAVMSKSHLGSWTYNYGYHWVNNTTYGHNPYLFFMQREAASTTFSINNNGDNATNETCTLANSTWYHFTLNVNIDNATVVYTITKKGESNVVATGTYTLPAGESAECDGIYIRNGRYNYEPGGAGIDNILVTSTESFDYTFTQPGTLTVSSAYAGCLSSKASYTADFVGVSIGAEGYATLGCNYALDLSYTGLDAAYTVTGQMAESVTLKEVTAAPAATGLLLKGERGIYRLPIVANAPATGSNLLTAVTSTAGYTVGQDNIYILNSKDSGTGFYACSSGTVIPAGTAYLRLQNGASNFYTIGDQTTTAINTWQLNTTSDQYFTPAGIRIKSPKKGIFIMNKKKIMKSSY